MIQSYVELVARGEKRPGENPFRKCQPCARRGYFHAETLLAPQSYVTPLLKPCVPSHCTSIIPRAGLHGASTLERMGRPGPSLLRLNPVSHPCYPVALAELWSTLAPPSLPWGLFLPHSPPDPPGSFSGLHSPCPEPLSHYPASFPLSLSPLETVLLVDSFCFPTPWSSTCRR